ncbi:MAG: hypothetical protein WCS73_07225 [Lentisphaeria bacterium]
MKMSKKKTAISFIILMLFITTLIIYTSYVMKHNKKLEIYGELFFEDDFNKYYLKTIPDSALSHINKLNLNKTDLEKILLPRYWSICWNKYPPIALASNTKHSFTIKTPASPLGKFALIGLGIKVLNYDYHFELNLSNVSNIKNAIVEFGINNSGNIHSGRHLLQTIKMRPNMKNKIYTLDIKAESEYQYINPIITVQGDVKFNCFRVYRKVVPEITIVTGEIIDRSKLPDPKESDYPNCRYTAHFKGNSIIVGDQCKKELSLIMEGFKDYHVLDSNSLQVGDKVRCVIIPYENLSDKEKVTQQVDDLALFNLDNYYVKSVVKIKNFKNTNNCYSGLTFLDSLSSYTSIFERHINPPIAKELAVCQKKAIANDLKKMDVLLSDFKLKKDELNQQFDAAWKKNKAKDPHGYNRVYQKKKDYVWRNINGSFWSLPVNYTFIKDIQYLPKEKLAALRSLKKVLENNGVQLIVSFVPDLFDISARVMNPEFRKVPDFQTAIIVKQLSEIGIEAIYASDEMIQNYSKYPWTFFYPRNGHPSDNCQDVMATLVAKRLGRYHLPKNLDFKKLSFIQSSHIYKKYKRYFFPEDCDIGKNKANTSYNCLSVSYAGKRNLIDENSEILILGNSYIRTPMTNLYPSFPSVLASKILYKPYYYMILGNGPMIAIIQNIFAKPEKYLKGRKVVVLQMGIKHALTSLYWNDLQVMDNYQKIVVGKKNIVIFDKPNKDIQYFNQKKDFEKKLKEFFPFQIGDEERDLKNWKKFPNKREFICKTTAVTNIATIKLENIDFLKQVICIIPTIIYNNNAVLTVNGHHENIPLYYMTLRWQNIVYQLPAGTTTLHITAKPDKKNTFFAIRNIMIYQ